MTDRQNQEWIRDLKGHGHDREAALADLRARLIMTLRKTFSGNPCVNEALLEDAIQESLIRIISKLTNYRFQARFITWATTIAVHAVVTEMRRRRWSDVSLEGAAPELRHPTCQPVDPSLSPSLQFAKNELLELLNHLIQHAITERQRTVLIAEFNGMPLEEIARRLGTNRNAVYKLAHDARKSLKAKLEAQGYTANEIATLAENSPGARER